MRKIIIVFGRYPDDRKWQNRLTTFYDYSLRRNRRGKQAQKTAEKKKRGRPKGSKNKAKAEVVLNAELICIQTALRCLVERVGSAIALCYVVLDGHFGNYPSAYMICQENLHLISKLRWDAGLYQAFEGDHSGPGSKPKYGAKLDVRKMDPKYLKKTITEGKFRTDIYKGQFYNKEFAFSLNMVILLKTHLATHAQAHVIFSAPTCN